MKTVIEMAREAGLAKYGNGLREGIYPFMESIERFAELIRADAIADEREACAQLCEDQWQTAHDIQDAIRARGNT